MFSSDLQDNPPPPPPQSHWNADAQQQNNPFLQPDKCLWFCSKPCRLESESVLVSFPWQNFAINDFFRFWRNSLLSYSDDWLPAYASCVFNIKHLFSIYSEKTNDKFCLSFKMWLINNWLSWLNEQITTKSPVWTCSLHDLLPWLITHCFLWQLQPSG